MASLTLKMPFSFAIQWFSLIAGRQTYVDWQIAETKRVWELTRGVESLIGLAQDQAFILNEEESFRELLVACHSELVQPRYP